MGCMMSNQDNDNSKHIKAYLPVIKGERVLDPALLQYTAEYNYLKNMNLTLIDLTKNGSFENQLAEKVELSDDRRQINITIKDATFSDGTPITIEDVYYSLKRAILLGTPHLDSKNVFSGGSNLKSLDQDFAGIKITGKKALQITLSAPMKEIFYYLQLTDFSILHPSQYRKDKLNISDWMKVTSGPYHLEERNGETLLVANKKALNYNPDMPNEIIMLGHDFPTLTKGLKDSSIDFGSIPFGLGWEELICLFHDDRFWNLKVVKNLSLNPCSGVWV